MKKLLLILGPIAIVLAIAFMIFVFPTRYRYERTPERLVRIDRFSGEVEALTETGWRPLQSGIGTPYAGDPRDCPNNDPWSAFCAPPNR